MGVTAKWVRLEPEPEERRPLTATEQLEETRSYYRRELETALRIFRERQRSENQRLGGQAVAAELGRWITEQPPTLQTMARALASGIDAYVDARARVRSSQDQQEWLMGAIDFFYELAKCLDFNHQARPAGMSLSRYLRLWGAQA